MDIVRTFLAALKRSRTRRAPTPTYISSNSEPEAYLNGTPASPAMARARSVLPVPGGPVRERGLGVPYRRIGGYRTAGQKGLSHRRIRG